MSLSGPSFKYLFWGKNFSGFLVLCHHFYVSFLHNFWHLSAKILYTVELKTAFSPCVHFEVAASATEKKHITSPCVHF